jgi:hypothetical protein
MSNIAIVGFGRIGRTALKRALSTRAFTPVAISDVHDVASLAALFSVDTNYGRWHEPVKAEADRTRCGARSARPRAARRCTASWACWKKSGARRASWVIRTRPSSICRSRRCRAELWRRWRRGTITSSASALASSSSRNASPRAEVYIVRGRGPSAVCAVMIQICCARSPSPASRARRRPRRYSLLAQRKPHQYPWALGGVVGGAPERERRALHGRRSLQGRFPSRRSAVD